MPVRVRFKVTGLDKASQATKLTMMNAVMGHLAAKGDEAFQATHESFSAENQPKRIFKGKSYRKSVRFTVGRLGEVYTLLHLGSPGHPIEPVNSEQLVFFEGYRPSTVPGVLRSTSSSYFGAQVARKVVDHPGFKPRNFDTTVVDEVSSYIFSNFNEIEKIAQAVIDAA